MTLPVTLRSRLLEMTNAGSVEELWAMHLESMAGFGFDRLMYGFTRYRTTTSLGDPNDFVLLTNHSTDYIDGFGLTMGQLLTLPMILGGLALILWARRRRSGAGARTA